MARHAQPGDGREVGVYRRVEIVQKQVLNPWTTEITGRQADVVYDQQVNGCLIRPRILIGRNASLGLRDPIGSWFVQGGFGFERAFVCGHVEFVTQSTSTDSAARSNWLEGNARTLFVSVAGIAGTYARAFVLPA